MPIYEYLCEKCGHEFECKLMVDERDNPQKCPECGGTETKRAFGSFTMPKLRKYHFKSQVEGRGPQTKIYPRTKPKYAKEK